LNQALTNNPTNPSPDIYPKALQNISGVECVNYVGYILNFYPRDRPLLARNSAIYLPVKFEGVL
jgi:hypothetical protein